MEEIFPPMQAVTNAEGTVSSIKRHMGTDYKVTIDGKSYTPQAISAMILQKLKADAEAYLGEKVTEAVITVPASTLVRAQHNRKRSARANHPQIALPSRPDGTRRCGSRSDELTRHLAQKSRFIKEKMTGQHRNMLAFLASRSAQPMS